jgi:hypothetical protein
MKRPLALAAALLFASSAALAFHCPKDMAEIDAALAKNPKLTDAQMKEVRDLRASGEAHHKVGEHQQAVDDLEKAKKILGISKS